MGKQVWRGLSLLRWLVIIVAFQMGEMNGQNQGVSDNDASPSPEPQSGDISVTTKAARDSRHGSYNGGGGGGGWWWGGGGGGGGGGSGWGWGGGGGGWWAWGCRKELKNGVKNNGGYMVGEYAVCMGRVKCRGERLDCPLHCGARNCLYDCTYSCKAHCHPTT